MARYEDRIADLVVVIAAAARAGAACPKNSVLAARLGWQSTSGPAECLAAAVEAGLVSVERGRAWRIVAAADSSWRTADTRPRGRPKRPKTAPRPPAALSSAKEQRRSDLAAQTRRLNDERRIEGRAEGVLLARLSDLPSVCHRTCQWIHGDPHVHGWRFCSAPSAGGSWCAEHYGRVFYVRVKEAA